MQVSHETIYQFAYSKDGHAIDLWHHLPEHRRRRRGRGKRRSQAHKFADELSIRHRPEAISAREEFGSWEGDLIQFRKEFGTGNVTSLVERVSRLDQGQPVPPSLRPALQSFVQSANAPRDAGEKRGMTRLGLPPVV